MALSDTVFGRIRVYFRRRFPKRAIEGPKQSLGEDGLGFDDIAIQGKIRDDLNSNEFGFSDMLTSNIPRTEFDESTSLGDIRDFVLAHSDVATLDDYTIKMNERVRLALRDAVASLARPTADPKDVHPSDNVSQWVAEADREKLQVLLNEDLAKYLFRDVPLGELTGMLSTIQDRIVARTRI